MSNPFYGNLTLLFPFLDGNFTLKFPFQDDTVSEVLVPDNKVSRNADKNIYPCVHVNSDASSKSGLDNSIEQRCQTTILNKDGVQDLPTRSYSYSSSRSVVKDFAKMMGMQEACTRALLDPNKEVACKLWHQSLKAMKNHYARDVELAYSGGHLSNIDVPGNEFDSLLQQIKHRKKIMCHSLMSGVTYPISNAHSSCNPQIHNYFFTL